MQDAVERYRLDMESGDRERQMAAAMSIAQADPPLPELAVPLVELLRSEDEEVNEAATAALEELGAPSADSLASLGELARDPHGDVAYWAVTLLGRAGSSTVSVNEALLAALDHSQLAVRERAAWAIGQILPTDPRIGAALERIANEPQPRLARLASETRQKLRSGRT